MDMKIVDMRAFRRKARLNKNSFRRFLTKMEKNPVGGLTRLTIDLEPAVWNDVNCLGCANCCKTMTPTFSPSDIKRISAHFKQTPAEFKAKWLYKERGTGDWVNKNTPCQFLDLKTNMCSIYEIRPSDCAGFPHLKKPLRGYGHVHKQNIEWCPATYRMVERLRSLVLNS